MKLATLPALIFLTLAMVIFNACSATSASLAGEWKLVSYGNSASPTPALANVDTSISFEVGQFGGTVGCNAFGGDYTLSGSQMSTGSIISTMMFCEQTSAQESAVLQILSDKTLNIFASGDRLILTTEDGAAAITLEKK